LGYQKYKLFLDFIEICNQFQFIILEESLKGFVYLTKRGFSFINANKKAYSR